MVPDEVINFVDVNPFVCDKKVVTQANFAVAVFHRGEGGGAAICLLDKGIVDEKIRAHQ